MTKDKLINKIAEIENTWEYGTENDFFGTGFDYAKRLIIRMIQETDWKKKCINNYSLIGGSKCRLCGDYCIPFKPSPQPQLEEIEQMKKLDSERELVEIDKLNLDEYIENFDPLEIPSRTIGIEIMVEKKINEIIDHLNSIKKDRHSDIRKVNELSKKK